MYTHKISEEITCKGRPGKWSREKLLLIQNNIGLVYPLDSLFSTLINYSRYGEGCDLDGKTVKKYIHF